MKKFSELKAHYSATQQDTVDSQKILGSVATFISGNHLGTTASGSLESLSNDIQMVKGSTEALGDSAVKELMMETGIDKLPMHQQYSTEALASSIVVGNMSTAATFFHTQGVPTPSRTFGTDAQVISTEGLAGSGAAASIIRDGQTALEAWGIDIDKVNADSRLNLALTITRAHRGLIDRVVARDPQEQVTVVTKIPAPELYDLAAASNKDPKIRLGNHMTPIIDLYTDPSKVSTAPKRIVGLKANDVGGKNALLADNVYNVAAGKVNILSLSMDENRPGFNAADFTDTISPGGRLECIYVTLTKPGTAGNPDVSQSFRVDAGFLPTARLTEISNSTDSGDRSASPVIRALITKDTKDSTGANNTVWTAADANLALELSFKIDVNLKTWDMSAGGVVNVELRQTGASSPSAGTVSALEALKLNITQYTPFLEYSEENLRKTTTAGRMNYRQQTFEIPVGRTIVFDYSIQQEEDRETLNVLNNMNVLGNTERHLAVLRAHINDVYARKQYEAAYAGEVPYKERVEASYLAGTLNNIRVIKGAIDFSDLAVMRESERLTEIHSRITQQLLNAIAEIKQTTLYQINLEPGEQVVWKVLTSTRLQTVGFGITQYHNELADKTQVNSMSDYSLLLPNGDRLDIVQSEFKSLKDTIIVFPVREANPAHATSFMTIQDRGAFVGQYTKTEQSAVTRRTVINSREIAFVSNPIAMEFTIANLEEHLPKFN